MPAAELAHLAGVGTSVIKTMASIGLLEGVERTMRRSFAQPDGKQQGPALSPEQAVAAQGAGRQGAGARFLRDPARRRARRRQDRGLFRGDRRGPRLRPAGAGAAARDRAHRAVAETLRGSLRRAAGGVAFRPDQPGAARDLARHRRGQGAGRGRRALGAVPAVRQARPDRGRRGARQLLQAGRGRHLQRARHGGGARAAGLGADRARLGHALARERRQRHRGPLRRAAPAGPPRRPATGEACRRSISGASRRRAAAGCRRRSSRR